MQSSYSEFLQQKRDSLGEFLKQKQNNYGEILQQKRNSLGEFLKQKQNNYGEILQQKRNSLGEFLKQNQDSINNLLKPSSETQKLVRFFEFVQSPYMAFLLIFAQLSMWVALLLLYVSTSKMSKDDNVKKYYELNIIASVMVSIAVVLFYLWHHFQDSVKDYENEIISFILLMLFIGCIILYINTNKMANDKDAKEYYNSNISSSVLVLMPFICMIGFKIYIEFFL